ncbi:GntR family transcriptional regulator [Variovorax sp. W2I14]|uniref:GntR family transcriptional regulator n=1 Tax=Variovorax sp. W2I14 TaxID=3042290 RepID=UPI003D1E0448
MNTTSSLKLDDLSNLSWSEKIARILKERIVNGTLKADARVLQDAVAKEFGTSHIPVREAFRQLQSEGLLVATARKGVRVAPLDLASVVEITMMREALEPLALAGAMKRMTNESLALAKAAIAASEKAKNMRDWEEANRRFHMALYEPCGMPILLNSIRELHVARTRYMIGATHAEDWDPTSSADHAEILLAVRFGEVDRACELLKKHIGESRTVLVKAIIET